MHGASAPVGDVSSFRSPLGRSIVLAAIFALVVLRASVGTAQTTQATPSGAGTRTMAADELKALQQEAGQGDAAAACQLGTIYEAGQAVPPDYAEALKWFSIGFTLSGDLQNNCGDKRDRLMKQLPAEQRAEGSKRVQEWNSAVHFTFPTVRHSVRADYTKHAMKAKITGKVGLYVVVSVDGAVTQCRVWQPLDDGLDREAVKAARQWRFAPAKIGDRAVPVVVDFWFTFDMK